jgi:hypothetical protein
MAGRCNNCLTCQAGFAICNILQFNAISAHFLSNLECLSAETTETVGERKLMHRNGYAGQSGVVGMIHLSLPVRGYGFSLQFFKPHALLRIFVSRPWCYRHMEKYSDQAITHSIGGR